MDITSSQVAITPDHTMMIIMSLSVILGAIIMDITLGEPRNRYHPTVWAGRMMAWLVPKFAGRGMWHERAGGIFTVSITCIIAILLCVSYMTITHTSLLPYLHMFHIIDMAIPGFVYVLFAILAYVVSSSLLLKCTISIRAMQEHARAVVSALHDNNDIERARIHLSMIVKRKTASLDKEHVISGVIESIGESIADGMTGPLFYFGVFGLPGAFAYRIINTADSMIGYKSKMFCNIGWFAAHTDTILTFAPARLAGLCMVGAAALLGFDWRGAYRAIIADGSTTESRNSGYVMAPLAGALGIRLQKEGHYTLCSHGRQPEIKDAERAMKLARCTVFLFAACVCMPLMILTGVAAASMSDIIILFGGA